MPPNIDDPVTALRRDMEILAALVRAGLRGAQLGMAATVVMLMVISILLVLLLLQ